MSQTKDIDRRILEVEKQIAILNLELIHLKQSKHQSITQSAFSESQFDDRSLLNG